MSEINNKVKFFLIHTNIFYVFLGFFICGFAVYLLFADWGEGLVAGFFVGTGIIFFELGLILLGVAVIGCQGINNQILKYGFCSGRKVLAVYMLLIILGLVFLGVLVLEGLTNVHKFTDVVDVLETGPTSPPELVGIEPLLEDKFNSFFFGAANSCEADLYLWFWDWVNDNCPAQLSQLNCQACYSFSATICIADEDTCYNSGVPEYESSACPYTVCRQELLSYLIKRIKPFSYVAFGVACFQIVVIAAVLMLICYHPRDTLEQILFKSGTIMGHRKARKEVYANDHEMNGLLGADIDEIIVG